jgi:rare lipoprotein A (peptidoglycan hydrolase)
MIRQTTCPAESGNAAANPPSALGAIKARLPWLLVAWPLLMPLPAQAAEGVASFYGKGFHGRKTANGERFNQNAMTAAHKTLPFGTRVRVTHVRSGRSVVVRINDRGPFIKGRSIDLSRGAAARIGMVQTGVARVRMEILGKGARTEAVPVRVAQATLLRELF